MRDIKFKGKHLISNKILIGDLSIKPNFDGNRNNYFINNIIVDPKTIGQYTGLKDMNDVEIYEGDRITAGFYDENDNIIVEKVLYKEGSFLCDHDRVCIGDLDLSIYKVLKD